MQMVSAEQHNSVFRALSDPTRRAVYERLVGHEATVKELTRGFDVSQPAISQHLKILRDAGLVRARREGREAHYSADAKGLSPLIDWVKHHEAFWHAHGENLKKLLEEME
ncbi:MAG: metalloregulator ArsR/SmtB family transcription factor [Rhizomicrobium sp.]